MSSKNTQGIQKTVANLLKNLPPRNRDIITRRFGLKTGQKETLEGIGQSYSVTRERVRQIEEATLTQLKDIASKSSEITPYVSLAKEIINENSGVIKEDDLFQAFSGRSDDNVTNSSLAFILTLSAQLERSPENDNFHPFWAVDAEATKSFKESSNSLIQGLHKTSQVVDEREFYNLAQKNNISEKKVQVAMAVSKEMDRNIFGEVGLVLWPEVKPKGVRDKAYLVLKKEKKPLHFSEIAKLINTAGFNRKKANVQTVHNELIKDGRFILVGRGMYALSEWGYKAGTVKDILVDILKNAPKPMLKQAILSKVMNERMVKENTILLNLQDSKTFLRNSDGTYQLRG